MIASYQPYLQLTITQGVKTNTNIMNKDQKSKVLHLTDGRVVPQKRYWWMVTELAAIIIHDLLEDGERVTKIPPFLLETVPRRIWEGCFLIHLRRLLLFFNL